MYQWRRLKFVQKEKLLLNYKVAWIRKAGKGCSSTHVDVGLIFVWKQAGTPRAKVNLVNV